MRTNHTDKETQIPNDKDIYTDTEVKIEAESGR